MSLRTFYRHFASKHDLLFADYAGLQWFRVSAQECAASAVIDAEPDTTAAKVLAVAIARLAPNATSAVKVLSHPGFTTAG